MLLRLQRHLPLHGVITGRLTIDNTEFCDTLEREQVAIAPGFYPVRLTMSPRFEEVLPLIDRVVGRTGIRIHPGNTARDTSGCILVGVRSPGAVSLRETESPRLLESRKTFNALREVLLKAQQRREEIWIEVLDAERYPDYEASRPPVVSLPRIEIPDEVRDLMRLRCAI